MDVENPRALLDYRIENIAGINRVYLDKQDANEDANWQELLAQGLRAEAEGIVEPIFGSKLTKVILSDGNPANTFAIWFNQDTNTIIPEPSPVIAPLFLRSCSPDFDLLHSQQMTESAAKAQVIRQLYVINVSNVTGEIWGGYSEVIFDPSGNNSYTINGAPVQGEQKLVAVDANELSRKLTFATTNNFSIFVWR